MSDITMIIITNFIVCTPYLTLGLIPFWGDWKLSKAKLSLTFALFIVCWIACATILASADFYGSGRVQQIYNITCLFFTFVFYYLAIKAPVSKMLYVYLVSISYLIIVGNIEFYIEARFFPDYFNSYASIYFIVMHVLLLLVSVPFVALFFRRFVKAAVINSQSPAWNNMWLIPAIFLMVIMLYNETYDASRLGNPQYLAITLLLAFGLFFVYYLVIKMIVQAEKRAAAEAEAKREAATLERLNQLKTDLMRTISHETLTPLSVMKIYAEITAKDARKSGVGDEFVSNLDTIADEAGRLADLMEEMRQLSLAREYAKDTQPVDVEKTISQIAGLYSMVLQRKGTALKLDITDGLPIAYGNSHELTQVMFNLLRNADNHTENGAVMITAEFTEGIITVTVADTGTGIAADLLPRVFERGVHGENDGSGFGLAICRDIITAYGGDIWIESEPGNGVTVTFTLTPYTEERGGIDE